MGKGNALFSRREVAAEKEPTTKKGRGKAIGRFLKMEHVRLD